MGGLFPNTSGKTFITQMLSSKRHNLSSFSRIFNFISSRNGIIRTSAPPDPDHPQFQIGNDIIFIYYNNNPDKK